MKKLIVLLCLCIMFGSPAFSESCSKNNNFEIAWLGLEDFFKPKSESKRIDPENLMWVNVSEFSGNVEYKKDKDWTKLVSNIAFKEDTSFKTLEKSHVSIRLQCDNQVKLYSSSEMQVNTPLLDYNEPKINNQFIELDNGEMTIATSIEGRGILTIKVSNLNVVGLSGLFKIIYNKEKDEGEVVVKNGLTEIYNNNGEITKLSGFYKVTFEGGVVSNPTQASVIRYDWK